MRVGVATAVAVVGIEGKLVRVEAVMLSGLPAVTIVGLPDTAISESRERVRAAFASAGLVFPPMRLTINLSPADIPKTGTAFDLAIAVAILGAMGGSLRAVGGVVMGELGLDGSVRPVKGVLPAALTAAREERRMVIPYGCGPEAEVADAEYTEVWHLSQVAHFMGIACGPVPHKPPRAHPPAESGSTVLDLSDVRGQDEARHALEIAAAGGHHLLLTGAPGVGKSMLAARMPGILPELSVPEAVEVAAIASAVGEFHGCFNRVAPYSNPHHTISGAALVGGGSVPKPGAISRAHNGVLFLDEMPEFSPHALQALREPMESGVVHLHRARAAVTFPARFQLIGAANPCRCGNYLDAPERCTCSVRERRDYFHRIGGPLIDRFDLSVVTPRLTRAEIATSEYGESSATVRARVAVARERQRWRLRETPWRMNSEVSGRWLREHTRASLDDHLVRGEISMRAADKTMRVAWTLADLGGRDQPTDADVALAFALRRRDLP